MPAEDLQGKTYGWWTVVQRWDFETYRDGNVRWLVECRCGKRDVRRSYAVKIAKEGCASCRAKDGRRRSPRTRKPRKSTRTKQRARMDDRQRRAATELYMAGWSYKKIAAELGVGYQAIWKYINGYTKAKMARHVLAQTSWQTYLQCSGVATSETLSGCSSSQSSS